MIIIIVILVHFFLLLVIFYVCLYLDEPAGAEDRTPDKYESAAQLREQTGRDHSSDPTETRVQSTGTVKPQISTVTESIGNSYANGNPVIPFWKSKREITSETKMLMRMLEETTLPGSVKDFRKARSQENHTFSNPKNRSRPSNTPIISDRIMNTRDFVSILNTDIETIKKIS